MHNQNKASEYVRAAICDDIYHVVTLDETILQTIFRTFV